MSLDGNGVAGNVLLLYLVEGYFEGRTLILFYIDIGITTEVA